MTDLIALCLVAKSIPSTKLYADEVFHILRSLSEDHFDGSSFMSELSQRLPDYAQQLKDSCQAFQAAYREVQLNQSKGIQIICYGHRLYPKTCYDMEDPPWVLSFVGQPCWQSGFAISVVGSREPSFETTQWMEQEFAVYCESERPIIVSGGARGVDQRAHALALRKNIPTIVVLPSGLGNIYPSNLTSWVNSIVEGGGCVLSEYAYDQRMHKYLFHHRNRLIAAFGRITLLVEARRRSGTLITAQHAAQLGRSVWVVPGHPLNPHFMGSLDLLSEGAQIVRNADDLKLFTQTDIRHHLLTSASEMG